MQNKRPNKNERNDFDSSSSGDSTVRAVERAIDIIDCLCANNGAMGILDISAQTRLAKSTTHRFLKVLIARSLVYQDPSTQLYSLGPRVIKWGQSYAQQLDLRRIALPHMERLRRLTNETVALSLLVGKERVYIEELESLLPIKLRLMMEPGQPLPLYEGASGKAMLAFLPAELQEEVLSDPNKVSFTDHTITDYQALHRELMKIREQGYATSFNERVMGAASIGAPIMNNLNSPFAVITVCGPADRFPPEIVAKCSALVKETAKQISEAFGCSDLSLKAASANR